MSLAGVDLNLLKVLDALLREGNTTRAGERIGLSQPAVSAALSRLRDRLDDPLFIRAGQGLTPTPFAETLRAPLQDVLAQLESLMAGPGQFDPAQSDRIFRICGADYFSELLFPQLLRELTVEAPRISIRLIDQLFETNVAALQKLEADIAFMPRVHFPDWIAVQEICLTSFYIAAPKDHPVLKAAGIKHGDPIPMEIYVSLPHASFAPEGHIQSDGDLSLANQNQQRHIAATFPTFGGIYTAVAEGGLLGGLPMQMAERYVRQGQITLHPTPVDLPPNHMCMIWNQSLTHDAAHRWLRDKIARIMGGHSDDPQAHTPGMVHV